MGSQTDSSTASGACGLSRPSGRRTVTPSRHVGRGVERVVPRRPERALVRVAAIVHAPEDDGDRARQLEVHRVREEPARHDVDRVPGELQMSQLRNLPGLRSVWS